MKKVTLRIDESVLAAVRNYAAASGSTVESLIHEYLRAIAARESDSRGARRRIRELSEWSPGRIGARDWKRDDLHSR